MGKLKFNGKPAFLRQGLLIVLPVVVLAAVGLASLRQDRILARHEATERAQTIADTLLPKIWNEVTSTNNPGSFRHLPFQTDSSGRLLFPPPFAPLPRPLISTELPPDNSQAIAQYDRAVLLARQGKFQEAADAFGAVVENFPDAIGDTGLELGPLARWKLLELQSLATNLVAINHLVTPDSFWSNALDHPTPLTPYFLRLASEHDSAVRDIWKPLWEQHELSRTLYSASRQHLGFEASLAAPLLSAEVKEGASASATYNQANALVPRFFWFGTPDRLDAKLEDRNWLAVRYEDFPTGAPTNFWFVCRFESEIGSQITALVNAERVPDNFGVGVVLAGKKLTWNAPDLRVWHHLYSTGRGGGQVSKSYPGELASTILASTSKLEQGTEQLKINLYLTSPSELFKRQRTRTFWFGSLIGISALAALIGLIAAWGAFNRQQQLSDLKSNFVSSVSHELRAPIASVRLMAESLERGKIPDAQKQGEYFRFMVQECRRLTSLIENVLDYSRIEQGRKQYEFEPTDLVALTRQTVKLMETYAEERQIKLETAIDPQLLTLHSQLFVDGKAIQQALVNLIDNAIKHSPKGGTVSVGLDVGGPRSEAGGPSSPDAALLDATRNMQAATDDLSLNSQPSTINISITDRGEGIPPEEHEKIFERFYRLGSELRRETQGVGIGLSIVKHIVEAHGGKVHVRSGVGQGSRFTILLPLNR